MKKGDIEKEFKRFSSSIQRMFPQAHNQCSFYFGDPEKPIHKVNKSQTQKYAVCLFPTRDVFIVWNYELHRKHEKKGASLSTVSLNRSWDDLLKTTFPYYKKLGHRKDAPYEKVYVVKKEDYIIFFSDLDEYMRFNEYDMGENHQLIGSEIAKQEENDYFNESQRKKYSSVKLQRKADFRQAVFEQYGCQCAVCRTEIQEILQAAHLHGYEVADTDLSADTAEHGICLCANHHLMYDRGVIDLNISEKRVVIKNDIVVGTAAYKELERYHFTLVGKKAKGS